jgi:4-carboxymuconolactone decarboxylase
MEEHVARYDSVNFDRLTPEHKALYDAVRANRPKLVGPFSVLMHNPPLADAVNRVVDAVRKDGTLDKRLYELIVLIVVRHASASYAWAVHDPLGRKAGLAGDVVDAIQARRQPSFAKADEKAIYDAITELLNSNRIGDAAYQALVRQFGLEQTVEIITCAGLYCMLGAVINAFEVPTPNGEKPF